MIEPKFFYSKEKITDFKILDPDNKHEIFDLAKKCHSVDYKDPKTNLYYFTSIYNKFYENGINLWFMEVVDGIGDHYIVRDDRITGKIDYTICDEFAGDQLFCMVLNNTKMPRYSFGLEAYERYLSNSLKSTISDHLSYSDNRLTVRDFSKLPKRDPLNYDPVIPIGIGLTQPIIFEPWV